MKNIIRNLLNVLYGILVGAGVIVAIILFFKNYKNLTTLQLDTFKILAIICICSMAYCFIVGEISRNNSQMDKLWSILPIVYTWIIAIKGSFNYRLVVIAILVTLWGIRLTYNFAKKGAYTIKFWAGEEDYRWIHLRHQKGFNNKFIWAIFDLFFISIYQNFLVLLLTIPALLSMGSDKGFNYIDIIAIILTCAFLIIELIADDEQMSFQTNKYKMLGEGKKLEELPDPYNKGFNTVGLWNHSRHPNYLGEQGIWLSIYLFSVASGVGIYNYSVIGALLLLLVFLGSSILAESISSSKYPLYKDYMDNCSKFFLWTSYIKKDKNK